MRVSHSNDHSDAWANITTHPAISDSPSFHQVFPSSRILIPRGSGTFHPNPLRSHSYQTWLLGLTGLAFPVKEL